MTRKPVLSDTEFMQKKNPMYFLFSQIIGVSTWKILPEHNEDVYNIEVSISEIKECVTYTNEKMGALDTAIKQKGK